MIIAAYPQMTEGYIAPINPSDPPNGIDPSNALILRALVGQLFILFRTGRDDGLFIHLLHGNAGLTVIDGMAKIAQLPNTCEPK